MGTLHVRDIIILISKGFPKALGHLEMILFFHSVLIPETP